MQEIVRTPGDLAVDDASVAGQVGIHSGIHDFQLEPVLAAEEIDPARAVGMGEMADLLIGDLTGSDGHALADNAVIGRENDILRMVQGGGESVLDQSGLHSQLFEPSERAAGLGQIVNPGLKRVAQAFVGESYIE